MAYSLSNLQTDIRNYTEVGSTVLSDSVLERIIKNAEHTIFRAIEEGKNIIRSTNNGISAYIDSNGIVISKLESTKKGVIEINKYKKFNETLFSKFGNKIFFYILLFYIIVIFFLKKWEIK